MPHSYRTPDNKVHTPLDDDALIELVGEYAGHEVAAAVKESMAAATEELEEQLADATDEIAEIKLKLDCK